MRMHHSGCDAAAWIQQSGYREGLDEGKGKYLQQGFNAGFAEGSRAGFEYGLARGALQALSAHLAPPSEAASKAAALQSELSALTAKQAMARACLELLAVRPLQLDAGEDGELAGALSQLRLGAAGGAAAFALLVGC
ncbi:hypothetical protein MNEG_7255 [Monoraphidium neglectum]|uniref:Essential protein Yae1 N-terminal domain-containing protein n=1 Tax=Monoraphidium neglectum TaxID=145388 RepID=A0A0D2KZW7_9CHLO|nr:hypothetical protein MNEG_7255 [Monoraphidium neglectum]KIZ00704.1 hypothetical protein MNEG_7255 [Monoraphidium neglectum]|eukprot:XP_013899723.1 hypothetical protein MNEG_7255 [Monoraphidium neglectum]